MNLKSLAQRIGMVALLCMVGTAVFAQNTKTLDSGITLVKLSSTFTSALQSLNVTPGTVAPTRIRNGSAWFPVTGGAIDLDTAAGNIIHSGGLTLEAGGIKVSLQSFIIDTKCHYPARYHSFNFTDSIFHIFRINVIPRNNDDVLFPTNDKIFVVIDKPIIATIIPAIFQYIGSLFRIIPITIKH